MRHYRMRLYGLTRGVADLADSWRPDRSGIAERIRTWRRSWHDSSVLVPGYSWSMTEPGNKYSEQLLWSEKEPGQ